MGTFWAKVFAESLTQQVVSLETIIRSALGIGVMLWVSKKCKTPRTRNVILLGCISYGSLLGFVYGPGTFLLVNAVTSTFYCSLGTAWGNSLLAQNLGGGNERRDYDNYCGVVSQCGRLVGAGIAIFFVARDIALWKVWIGIFLLFDLDCWFKLILIKYGVLVYTVDKEKERA
jgi:hypothetical protein